MLDAKWDMTVIHGRVTRIYTKGPTIQRVSPSIYNLEWPKSIYSAALRPASSSMSMPGASPLGEIDRRWYDSFFLVTMEGRYGFCTSGMGPSSEGESCRLHNPRGGGRWNGRVLAPVMDDRAWEDAMPTRAFSSSDSLRWSYSRS